MTKPLPRAVAAPSPVRVGLAVTLTAILSLALLLTPRLGHAAVVAPDADLIGKWVVDKADPASDYAIAAGPAAGTLRILVPAKAVGRKAGETLVLQRIGPGEFATAKGAPIWGNFKVTQPRRAEFRLKQDDPKAFIVGDVLLTKQ